MVIKFTNFLVSATLLLKILKDGNPRINFSDQCYYHIETSQLICRANQLTGFYMMGTLVLVKRTMTFPYLKMKRSKFVILSIQKLDSHVVFLGYTNLRFFSSVKCYSLGMASFLPFNWRKCTYCMGFTCDRDWCQKRWKLR